MGRILASSSNPVTSTIAQMIRHLTAILALSITSCPASAATITTKHPDWSPDGLSLAFEATVGGNENVFIANIQRSEATQLTDTPKMDSYPRFTPDGATLLFLSRRYDRFTIHRVETANLQVSDYAFEVEALEPAISPDGRHIAFRGLLPESDEIMLASTDGRDLQRLTSNETEDGFPSFSSDGKSLFIHRKVGRFNQIFRLGLGGQVETQLTASQFNSWHAHHSPDGKSIVFEADKGGARNIFRMNLESRHIEQLTHTPENDGYPKWSPDGKQIAFHSDRDGATSVYTMRADGSAQRRHCFQIDGIDSCDSGRMRRLTDWPDTESAPRISSNGEWLAFHATVDGNTDIYVQQLSTGEIRRITSRRAIDSSPSWSPSGEAIAYKSVDGGLTSLRISSMNGINDQVVLTLGGVSIAGPDWSPSGAQLAYSILDAATTGSSSWGRSTIHTFNLERKQQNEITKAGDEWWPRWDSASEWLYYYKGTTDDIEAVHTSTGEVRSISNKRFVGWRPVPSPDDESILFVSEIDRWSIWIAPLDGSHAPLRVTREGTDDRPSFSPNGQSIVFVSDRSQSNIIELRLEDGHEERIAVSGTAAQELPGGKIAYLAPGDGTWDIVLHDRNADADAIVPSPFKPVLDLAVSPNGRQFAVTTSSGFGNNFGIGILDVVGSPVSINIDERRSERPVWCDDSKLVYRLLDVGDIPLENIMMYDVPSGEARKVTDSVGKKYPLDCSADGRRITYRQMGDERIEITGRRGDGWTVSASLPGMEGSWSPDGSRFAYLDQVQGQTDIFVLNSDGTVDQVTDDSFVEGIPRWSRDGSRLLFSRGLPNRDIWMCPLPELPWH